MKQAFNDFGTLLGIIGIFLFWLLLIGTCFQFLGCIFVEINVFESQDYFDMEDGRVIRSIKLVLCGIVVIVISFLKVAYWAVWCLLNLFIAFLFTRHILKYFGFRYYISHPDLEDEVSFKED